MVGILWVAVGVGLPGWGGRCRLGCMWVVLVVALVIVVSVFFVSQIVRELV